jgi:peptide deformylase
MVKSLPIAQMDDPILGMRAEPVENIADPAIQALIDGMFATLEAAKGLGLAAPQVSRPLRIAIIASRPTPAYPDAPAIAPTALINPVILDRSEDMEMGWEGCLSLPGRRGRVPRSREIRVEYRSRDGETRQMRLTGLAARVFQHEYDHLEGICYLDRMDNPEDTLSEAEYLAMMAKPGNGAERGE